MGNDETMHYEDEIARLKKDLEEALDAVEEIMCLDKGPSEEEWCEWGNKYLPLVKRNDRMTFTIEFC